MEKKRISRIRLVFRHITVRLMAVSFVAIVPLNILSMLLIGQIVSVYQDKLAESYQYQMELYASNTKAKLQYVENSMNAYLDAEQVYELSYGVSGSNEVAYVRIYNTIKDIRSMSDLPSLAFVIDNEAALCSLSYRPYRYPLPLINELKTSLLQQEPLPGNLENYSVFNTAGEVFLQKKYDFNKFTLGFLIDAERLLGEIYEGRSNDGETVYLSDTNGLLISRIGPEILLQNDDNPKPATIENLYQKNDLIIIEETVPLLGYKILRAIPSENMVADVPELIGFLRVLAIASMLALPLIWLLVSYLVLRPLHAVVKALGEIEKGNFEYRLSGKTGSFQMDYIYYVVNHMAHEIELLTIESYEKEIAKLQTDSVNLRLQVRPHTLLNSLSTIYSLAQSGENKKVMGFSLNLISYFRYVLRQNESLVPVEAEMEFIKNYLELQKVRFPNSFISNCHVEPDAAQILIPPLIIENFVENAVKYALVMGNTIEITVQVTKKEEYVHIDVNDTGCGMEKELAAKLEKGEIVQDDLGNHIGIWNCLRRLKLYYGDNAVFRINSALEQGTKIHMELPLEPQDIQVKMHSFENPPEIQ